MLELKQVGESFSETIFPILTIDAPMVAHTFAHVVSILVKQRNVLLIITWSLYNILFANNYTLLLSAMKQQNCTVHKTTHISIQQPVTVFYSRYSTNSTHVCSTTYYSMFHMTSY